MAVPEAPVDEHDDTRIARDEVGRARETRGAIGDPSARSTEFSSEELLRARAALRHGTHDSTSGDWVKDVHGLADWGPSVEIHTLAFR